MPDKEGSDDEKKSAKSVVNKKQKQFMNQEDYIPEKLSPENVNRELDKMDVRDKNKKPLISKEKSDSIQAKSTFNQASEYAIKQRPKIGGGERPDLKSKGGSASTGQSDIKIGGPKKDPKSAGGKPKGNAPVKVDIKKKPDLSKFFGDEYIPEEGYDIARDMGRVRPSKNKKDATTMPVSKEMRKTQKVNKGPSALERVKAKYGKSVMNVGKKKVKEELDLTKVAEAFGGYIIEQEDSRRRTLRRYIDAYNATNPKSPLDTIFGDPPNKEKKFNNNTNPTLDDLMKQQGVSKGGVNPDLQKSKDLGSGFYTKKAGDTIKVENGKPDEKEIEKIKPIKKRKFTTGSGEDAKDRGDTVTYGQPDEVKPKQGRLTKLATAAAANPAAALVAYDLGKGIIGKISKLRAPAVVGGKAGFRSAGGYQAT